MNNIECKSFHHSITDSVLVVGGYGDGGAKDAVELLSPTPGTESSRLGTFSRKMRDAVGSTLGEYVIESFRQIYNSNSLIIKYKLPF